MSRSAAVFAAARRWVDVIVVHKANMASRSVDMHRVGFRTMQAALESVRPEPCGRSRCRAQDSSGPMKAPGPTPKRLGSERAARCGSLWVMVSAYRIS